MCEVYLREQYYLFPVTLVEITTLISSHPFIYSLLMLKRKDSSIAQNLKLMGHILLWAEPLYMVIGIMDISFIFIHFLNVFRLSRTVPLCEVGEDTSFLCSVFPRQGLQSQANSKYSFGVKLTLSVACLSVSPCCLCSCVISLFLSLCLGWCSRPLGFVYMGSYISEFGVIHYSLTPGIAVFLGSSLRSRRSPCDLEPELCFPFQLLLKFCSTNAINVYFWPVISVCMLHQLGHKAGVGNVQPYRARKSFGLALSRRQG